ncbi:MAG: hypothetical protein AAF202_04075 [Pseudomonadota bacterium]
MYNLRTKMGLVLLISITLNGLALSLDSLALAGNSNKELARSCPALLQTLPEEVSVLQGAEQMRMRQIYERRRFAPDERNLWVRFWSGFSPKRRLYASLSQKFGADWRQTISGRAEVDLSNTDLSDDELREIVDVIKSDTKKINLQGNLRLTDKGIKYLIEELEDLDHLNVIFTGAEGKFLRSILQHQPGIRYLALQNLKHGDLKRLAQLDQLRTLDFHNSRVRGPALHYWGYFDGGPVSRREIIWFVKNRPKKFYKLILPDMKTENSDPIYEAAVVAGMQEKFISQQMVVKNIRFLSANYDGDTFTVSIPGASSVLAGRKSIRIAGVDTGELKSEDGSAENMMAIAARNFVRWHLERTKSMDASHLDLGKYGGRFPAEIWLHLENETVNIGQELIANGLALPYFGATKMSSDNPRIWEEMYSANKDLVDQLMAIY